MKHLVIFASGSGTNAEAIINFFEQHSTLIKVVLVISNNPEAYVLDRAKAHNIESLHISRDTIYTNPAVILSILKSRNIDFIVLAGFMLLFPSLIIEAYNHKIVNIHPALLPKYGGKGMYGINVHQAVIDNKEAESGITIHYVDDRYDEGSVIFQAVTPVEGHDTAESLADKIHILEHKHYPIIINQLIEQL